MLHGLKACPLSAGFGRPGGQLSDSTNVRGPNTGNANKVAGNTPTRDSPIWFYIRPSAEIFQPLRTAAP
jgi:hypothetical protein